MEHYILCASMYMCIASDGLSTGIPLISVMFCSLIFDQGAKGILPTVCAYSFYVYRIQISQVCINILNGPMSQSCIPVFSLQFMYIILL